MRGALLFFALFSVLAAGCADEEVVRLDLSGKRILMVVAPLDFRDEELLEPKEVFESGNAEVVIASKDAGSATGLMGATVDVDVDIKDVNVSKYDAVVFIGGTGAKTYFNDPAAHRIAKDAYDAGKVVAAICIAPSILANAGILKGLKATAFSSESSNIAAKSAGYTGRDVTVDGRVVTANGPGAARKFGNEIARLLG